MIDFISVIEGQEKDLNGYSAILPCVSHGNVPQLAVDLLIETLKMTKYGSIWHNEIIPIIGSNAFKLHDDPTNITTATELYVDEINKLILLQIRSPIIYRKDSDFIKKLVEFLNKINVTDVVILTSSYSYENPNIENSNILYKIDEKFTEFYVNQIRKDWIEYSTEIIHGGGYAVDLLKKLSEHNIATIILFKYVSEGDNRDVAKQYCINLIQKVVDNVNDIKEPPSWKFFFGSEPRHIMESQY